MLAQPRFELGHPGPQPPDLPGPGLNARTGLTLNVGRTLNTLSTLTLSARPSRSFLLRDSRPLRDQEIGRAHV